MRSGPGALVLFVLRLGMAAVFIVAAMPKIAAPDLFASAIFNYKILPPWGVNALALVLPWLELFIGVGLALGIWSRTCACVMAALMVVFMLAYASARARGLDIACGCFEVGEKATTAPVAWIILRDLGFLAAAAVLAWTGGGPTPLEWLRKARARPRAA